MGFAEIALLFVAASVFGLLAKGLKQPLLVGYLLAGVVLGYFGIFGEVSDYQGLGQIGVALLLFLVGLEMNLGDLPEIGKTAVITGLGQIVFTITTGFLLAFLLGFGIYPALYIAVALSFSSTIIIVKLLSEKRDLASLYGKISIGFLLVQDFVAVLILVFLGSLANSSFGFASIAAVALKATLLILATWQLSKKILPKIFEKLMANQELSLIVPVAWALGISVLVGGPLGFSYEIGGFMAGLALSNLPEHLQVAAKTRPLRDFFLTIFFLLLGFDLISGGLAINWGAAAIFSILVLVGNPVIVLTILGFLGYKKRTSFLSGLTVAQISEFSLILVAMGYVLGHLDQEVVSTIVIVAVVTMTLSTYLITHAEKLYVKIQRLLKIFERKNTKEQVLVKQQELVNHVVIVGFGKSGKTIGALFIKKNLPLLIVDFDPKVFRNLTALKIPVLFGDITDEDILEAANITRASLVISTINNFSENLSLLTYLKTHRNTAQTLIIASSRAEALKLYERGATYVVLPQAVAGEHIRHILKVYGTTSKRIKLMGKGHFNRLLTYR